VYDSGNRPVSGTGNRLFNSDHLDQHLEDLMWLSVKTLMPYSHDEDYRQAIIFDIKSKLGDVPVDITCINWGCIDIFFDNGKFSDNEKQLTTLNQTFFTGQIKGSCDRGMIRDEDRTII
jgi:hypothetical protein